jgi:hypothetical protein
LTIPARPTVYRGIQMRSRLEAGFAAWLDRREFTWSYEPRCFAIATSQYLPDFVIPKAIATWEYLGHDIGDVTTWRDLYVEVRPRLDLVEARRLTTIVQASEDAHLLYASPDLRWVDGAVLDGEEEGAVIFDCRECGKTTIAARSDSWQCRRCGAHDGDHHLRPITDLPWADTPLAGGVHR